MIPMFKSREDKLKEYLQSELKAFMFSELSDEFLKAAELTFLSGIPVPVKQADLKVFTEKGLSTTELADNMAMVLGTDTRFKYADEYLQYLNKLFDDRLVLVFAAKGEECLKAGSFRKGIAYLRAALMFRNDSPEAVFSYANGCRIWYLSMEGEEGKEDVILLLKSEARMYFELCTSIRPEFAPAWYFLGYAYLNAGEYLRAQIAWRRYMKCGNRGPDESKEISERLSELEDPVKIEKAINLLSEGRIEEGLRILEPYVESEYADWWPLHYNLAYAYRELGFINEAIEGFKRVLALSPSHCDSMVALSELYAEMGDAGNAEKYHNKSKLLEKTIE